MGAGVLSAAPTEEQGLLAVTVDGEVSGVGLVVRNEEGNLTAELDMAPLAGRASISEALKKPSIPGGIERLTADEKGLSSITKEDDEEKESSIPPWLAGVLPDTRMPLGLDLMGGIDLTLQVEMDEALVAQARIVCLQTDGVPRLPNGSR